jgi:chemotaxis protein MotB
MIEEDGHGLNIEIVDQDGARCFRTAPRSRYERTRRIIQKLAIPLKALPNRVFVPATPRRAAAAAAGLRAWELSADRANAVRQILEDEGCRTSHLFMVAGRPTASRCSRTIRRSRPTAA